MFFITNCFVGLLLMLMIHTSYSRELAWNETQPLTSALGKQAHVVLGVLSSSLACADFNESFRCTL